jgi:pSer/pThr/pTyr-binding forkhead associated (FHA) protein
MPFMVRKRVDGSVLERHEVTDKPLGFGRDPQADVPIEDDRVSRLHFTIVPRDGKFFLQDNNSTNGTWVNGVRIAETELKPNDRIRAGQTIFVFEMGESKGLATVIGEIEKSGKGYKTVLGEIVKETK